MPEENKKIQMSSTYGQFAGKNPFINEDPHEVLTKEMIEELHQEKIPNPATLAAVEEARNMTCARFANAEELFADLEKQAQESKK